MKKIIALSLCLFLNSSYASAAQAEGSDVVGGRPAPRTAVVPVGGAMSATEERRVLRQRVNALEQKISKITCDVCFLYGVIIATGTASIIMRFV